MRDAVICDAVRTGVGKRGGALAGVHPVDLLADTLGGLVGRCGLDAERVDDVIAGCVGQAGEQALNVARNAWLAAGLPESVPATTVDRQCGSSQQALHFAAQGVLSGAYDVAVACGVESMTRVPIMSNVGSADPFGERVAERYPGGLVPQGISAELIAARWELTRHACDRLALVSHRRAAAAAQSGGFDAEILPIKVPDAEGRTVEHAADEGIRPTTDLDKLGGLEPAFWSREAARAHPEIPWVVTAGNASQISDGAAALLVCGRAAAERLGLVPRWRVHTMALAATDPILMLTGPIPATGKALARAGLHIDDLDHIEINEAFAPVVLAWQHELDADPEKVNPRGGAMALGHPLGASGARLSVTMLHALEADGGRYGLQTMCEGGGLANATVVERLG